MSALWGRGSGGLGEGALGAPLHLGAAGTVACAIAADLNSDGIQDVIATNDETDQVSVFLGIGQDGRGNGTFAARVEYSTGDAPAYLASGDFNADGILDIAVANWNSSSVSVLLGSGSNGRGDGTLLAKTDFVLGGKPRGIATGDFNADGILDLAVANTTLDKVSILLGTGAEGRGDGGFAQKVDYVVGDEPRVIAVGDFNADGISDLAVVNRSSHNMSILLGNGASGRGDGTFAASANYSTDDQPRFVAVGDFNADSIQDLVVTCGTSNTANVFIGNGSEGRGDGTFLARRTEAVGLGPTGVAVADLNADGIQDLVVGNSTAGSVSILAGGGTDGRGDGTFAPKADIEGVGGSYTVVLVDFDSDLVLDALTANWSGKDVSVLLGKSACLPSP